MELRVTVDGHGKVVQARPFVGLAAAFAESEARERKLSYKPFFKDGHPVRATFVDTVYVLPLAQWRTPRQPFPVPLYPNEVAFRLERRIGSASGPGLLYSLQIGPNGLVHLRESWSFFENPLEFRRMTTAEQSNRLLDEFRHADFFSMKEKYNFDMTDAKGLQISITINGQTRTVQTYAGRLAGAPDSFYRLAELLDEVGGTSRLDSRLRELVGQNY